MGCLVSPGSCTLSSFGLGLLCLFAWQEEQLATDSSHVRLHAGPVVKLDSRSVCLGYTAVSGVEKGEDGWSFVSWYD